MTSPSSAFAAESHISYSEQLRAEAEAAHHAENRVRAVRVVAGLCTDVTECKELLSILGLDRADVTKAVGEIRQSAADPKPRSKSSAA
ncbi:hypothetical protein SAMN05892883_0167 [Jatrophihabitans sp. GAS493]|uniref:hypothetical protein n=1 Tax=Jatrophihabitans sp. GAS493 TaxID=1907575 RepID=UPI000BB7E339|nr:hypothetical protein [Jatrophihabitans sp. GAS493]SOD70470.1 hypothetical protein SAMN05892883_0167 [Jatrophihabitans sp. GAS493]